MGDGYIERVVIFIQACGKISFSVIGLCILSVGRTYAGGTGLFSYFATMLGLDLVLVSVAYM